MHPIIHRWACVALVAASAGSVAAQDFEPRVRPQVGRYQLVDSEGGVYLLDTATGQCWSRTSPGEWRDEGNPTRQLERARATPVMLKLPSPGVELNIGQHQERAIPGSNNSVILRIGDITEEHVFLSVITSRKRTLLEMSPVSPGQSATFSIGDNEFVVQVAVHLNVFFNQDFARVTVREAGSENQTTASPASDQTATAAAAVQGRVVLDGQPLATGRILFHSYDDSLVGAKINKDGQYKIEAVPVGVYKVTIDSENVAKKYATEDQSGLQVDVSGGANQFDFDLTSR